MKYLGIAGMFVWEGEGWGSIWGWRVYCIYLWSGVVRGLFGVLAESVVYGMNHAILRQANHFRNGTFRTVSLHKEDNLQQRHEKERSPKSYPPYIRGPSLRPLFPIYLLIISTSLYTVHPSYFSGIFRLLTTV